MKGLSPFRSIYARFAIIFIGIWWSMNSLAFLVMMRVLSGSGLVDIREFVLRHVAEMEQIRRMTSLVFLGSILLGTIILLWAVRMIVQPIRRLSAAAGQIAGGDFSVQLESPGLDEIGQLTDDFNQMAKSLQKIEILRNDFVANVSHEFKTPITAISGFASLIRDGGLSEDQLRDYARMISSESQRLSLLSANLLRLSELDADLVREQAHPFALDEQIRKSILLLEMQWQQKNIDLDIDLQSVTVTLPENLLQEVWLNLINNAIKFSPDGGQVRIRLTRDDAQAIFEIADQGCGIRDEDQPRIFERFFMGDKTRSKDGNGMGLAIVKKIVDLAGGTLSFNSEWGQGSTFYVSLPLSPSQPEVHHVIKKR